MKIHLSLRTKGILALSVLIAYLTATALLAGRERTRLAGLGYEMDACRNAVALLAPVEDALTQTLVATQNLLNVSARQPQAASPAQDGQLEALNIALEEIGARFPSLRMDIDRFRASMGALKAEHGSAHLAAVRDAQQILISSVHRLSVTFQHRAEHVAQRYRDLQQLIGVFAIGANVAGALASVVVIVVFFTRLAADIKRLEARAIAIVGGYDGAALDNRRHDEVGGLIDAVNRMQVGLRRSERQVEIARQQRFHQEKMAAVGSLASAIGHEVRNPIAAISGVAQFIASESDQDPRPQGRRLGDFAKQIVAQTERVSHILRQLGALTATASPEPALLDLNALVRSTCSFISFDKRFRGIAFEEELASGLPAVTAVADYVTQILMNLLFNAADALEDVTDPARMRIQVSTGADDAEVRIAVTDRGRGMPPEVLARAFDESFTTKPPTRGTGIGLFVCKSLMERMDGRIELASSEGDGTTATLHIPLARAPSTTGS